MSKQPCKIHRIAEQHRNSTPTIQLTLTRKCHKQQQQQTTACGHRCIYHKVGVHRQWRYRRTQTENKKDVEDIRSDNVGNSQIGILFDGGNNRSARAAALTLCGESRRPAPPCRLPHCRSPGGKPWGKKKFGYFLFLYLICITFAKVIDINNLTQHI